MPTPFPNLPPEQRGAVRVLDHASQVLKNNAMGDPTRRDVHVYVPPGYSKSKDAYPCIMILPGYTGTGEKLLARGFTDVSIATRIDRLIADGCPPFIAVLPDCMTRLGGSQYVDSPGLGMYSSYLVDEIRSAVDADFRTTGKWGVTGHSSGGFGAIHMAMKHPGAFSCVASHAGDLGFDLAYMADVPKAVRAVTKAGGIAAFVDGFWSRRTHGGDDFSALMLLCMCCAYVPDEHAQPLPCRYPVDFKTGEVDFEVYRALCAADPIHRLDDPAEAAALGALDLLLIDVGRSDEYNLHLGARRFVQRLKEKGIPHVYTEFDGGHRGMAWRYEVSLAKIAEVLQ